MTADFDAIAEAYRSDVHGRFVQLRTTAESALRQTSDADFTRSLGGSEDNSIAVIVKHVGGNLRSRFSDFMISDGEKPDRDRDGEFELRSGDDHESIMQLWETGWEALFSAIEALGPHDLTRTVYIRGEAHPVIGALDRQLSHHAYHVGQIVLLAKHFAGSAWTSLSIPRSRSGAFNAEMTGKHRH